MYKIVVYSWRACGLDKFLKLDYVDQFLIQLVMGVGLAWMLMGLVHGVRSQMMTAVIAQQPERLDGKVEKRVHGNFKRFSRVLDSDKVVFTSPADFIGKYMGFTARQLLQSCLGKVLFVDEAYGLIPRESHMYGNEALNELTSFIDAHKGEIVLIFTGYEETVSSRSRRGWIAASGCTSLAPVTPRRSCLRC